MVALEIKPMETQELACDRHTPDQNAASLKEGLSPRSPWSPQEHLSPNTGLEANNKLGIQNKILT